MSYFNYISTTKYKLHSRATCWAVYYSVNLPTVGLDWLEELKKVNRLPFSIHQPKTNSGDVQNGNQLKKVSGGVWKRFENGALIQE